MLLAGAWGAGLREASMRVWAEACALCVRAHVFFVCAHVCIVLRACAGSLPDLDLLAYLPELLEGLLNLLSDPNRWGWTFAFGGRLGRRFA